MPSALLGVIEKLKRGERLSDDAIAEIERTLDVLQGEGWSGYITADEAVQTLAKGDDDGDD